MTLAGPAPGTVEDIVVEPDHYQVILNRDFPHKARTLCWLVEKFMQVRDVIAGERSDADPTLYLHVRGRVEGEDRMMIFSVPYSKADERKQVDLIRKKINRQMALVYQLAAMEEEGAAAA